MTVPINKPIWLYLNGRPDIVSRFWSHVERRGPDDCWDWKASLSHNDYGRFKIASYETRQCNRVAWAIANERDPGNLLVRHTCDRPQCCNPTHLLLGTVKDNSDDKIARGRHRSGRQDGEHNGHAILTNAQIGEIVGLFSTKLTNFDIGIRYRVTHSLISRIRTGRSWQKVAAQYGWEPAIAALSRLNKEQAA